MLKHLPKDALAKIKKTLLYSKKSIYYNKASLDRRVHNGAGETQAAEKRKNDMDSNILARITKFQNILQILEKKFPVKIDFTLKLHLEADMKKLFKSRKVLTGVATVDPAQN